MLVLLELPLIGYVFAPEWTPRAVERLQGAGSAATRAGSRSGLALVIGALLVIRGLVYIT